MSDLGFRVTYTRGGVLTTLLDSVEKARFDMASGNLKRETLVVVEPDDADSYEAIADTVAALAPLFDAVLGPKATVPRPATPVPDTRLPPETGLVADSDRAVSVVSDAARTVSDTAPAGAPDVPDRRVAVDTVTDMAPGTPGPVPQTSAGVQSAGVGSFGATALGQHQRPGRVATGTAKAPAATETGTTIKKPRSWRRHLLWLVPLMAIIGWSRLPSQPEEVFYTRTMVKVRSAPRVAADTNTGIVLDRDTMVRGHWESQQDSRWFRIDDGPYEGDYLGSRALSERPRPALSGGEARYRPSKPLVLHEEPDANALVVETLPARKSVRSAGVTGTGWVEVYRPGGGGGVGYAQAEALGRRR